MSNSIKSVFNFLIVGFCLGAANIIPGVSGGTFLLIFGIYERTIKAISGVARFAKDIWVIISDFLLKKDGKRDINLKNSFIESDLLFLSLITSGAVISILSLSRLMKYLIENQYALTYAFFAGLIITSISIPFKMIKKISFVRLIITLAGILLTIYISSAVNPADKVIKKSAIYQERLENSQQKIASHETGSFKFVGSYSVKDYLYAALCGAVAISAMVLPGISGSLVLILMGEYFLIINAISSLKTLHLDHFLFLGIFASGMAGGIVVFARLVEYLFKRFHDSTLSFLGGLMIGSVYALWPFKKYLVQDLYIKKNGLIVFSEDMSVLTNINIMPESIQQAAFVMLAFISGIIFMGFMLRFEKK